MFLLLVLAFVDVRAEPPPVFIPRGVGGGGALFSPSFSPHNSQELFVACDMSELFHSVDAARRWRTVDFREIQGNRPARVEFTANPSVLWTIDCSSLSGVDSQRPTRSADGGITWSPLATDPTGGEAYTLLADPAGTNRVLVTDYNNLHVSTNGGVTFAQVFNFPNGGNGLFVGGAFFDGSTIYVGSTAGLLVSTNGGATFAVSAVAGIPATEEIVSLAGAKEGAVTRLFVVTVADGSLYPGILIEDTYGSSAYRGVYSLDVGAASWVLRTNGLAAGHLPLFVGMCRTNVSIAYLAGQTGSDYPVVYRTANGGVSWSNTFAYSGNGNVGTGWCGWQGDRDYTYDAYFVGFAVAPLNPDVAALTGYGFVHVTTNGGAGWRQGYVDAVDQNPAGANTPKGKGYTSIGLENTTCWGLTWASSNDVIASFSDIRGTRSTNAGVTWSFNYSGHTYNTMYRAVRHPNGTLYAGVGSAHDLYQSTTLQDSPINSASGEVLFSSNRGASWQRLWNSTNMVFHVALDPSNTSRLYAAVVHSTRGGWFVTSNLHAGASSTWTKLANPPRTEGHPFHLKVLNDGTLVCTYSGRRATVGGAFTASSGVFVSTDGGVSWIDRSHTNMHYWTKDIVVDPHVPGQSNWYVGVFSGWGGPPNGKGGLYRSTNRGVTWTRILNLDRVTSCTFHPVRSNELYVTSEVDGLWVSTNAQAASPSFSAVSSYPFRQPERVFFNPYDPEQIWVTSFGHGMRVGRTRTTAPVIRDVALAGDRATLNWDAEPGASYRLERSVQTLETFIPVMSNRWNFDSSITITTDLPAASAFWRVSSP